MRYQIWLLACCLLALIVSVIAPPYPRELMLQHAPTVLAMALLLLAVERRLLTDGAMACLVFFLLLHILGARYIYSYVPYDRWCQTVLKFSPAELFCWQRNHYDRLVHIAFGLLVMFPLVQVLEQSGRLSRSWAIAAGMMGVMALSAAYEVLEWGLAMVLAPEMADRYNGQQGDPWDAQKDMALAAAGAVAAMLWMIVWRKPGGAGPTHSGKT